MQTLKRRECSGFVKWPHEFGNRLLSGSATYQTKCDMFVGPCSCGHTHRETDSDVYELLDDFEVEIETLVLVPRRGEVRIPKYWEDINLTGRCRCSHLMGACNCGETHTGKEAVIKTIMRRHYTRIEHEES